jgi:hypothetical protein
MRDAELKRRLDGLIVLMVMAVSLLSGLVFGRTPGAEMTYAIISFIALGLATLIRGVE